MSSQRGNVQRNRPQKYQNTFAFKNNMHDTSKKTTSLNRLEMDGLCARCKAIIEWKIRYKKYKPLTKPRTWYVWLITYAFSTCNHANFRNTSIIFINTISDLPSKPTEFMHKKSSFSVSDAVNEVLRGLTSLRVNPAFLPLMCVENAVWKLMPFRFCEFAPWASNHLLDPLLSKVRSINTLKRTFEKCARWNDVR